MHLNAKLGWLLLAAICIPRFFLVLWANQTGNYGPIGLIMLLSAVIPFVLLTRSGRRDMGLTWPRPVGGLLLALLAGVALSLVLYLIGTGLYGGGYQNWYAYIGRSYGIPKGLSADELKQLFLIMAGTGMVFSPVGEELYFRGIVHAAFARSRGERRATLLDASAFALTHVAHFGLVYVGGGWTLYLLPTLIWVMAMFGASLLFTAMKRRTGSLW
ncbi:MAG: CPBP family intramembrane glutamic endopeptidase, partial [Lewinella sp.]